jgi:hypothetical protein
VAGAAPEKNMWGGRCGRKKDCGAAAFAEKKFVGRARRPKKSGLPPQARDREKIFLFTMVQRTAKLERFPISWMDEEILWPEEKAGPSKHLTLTYPKLCINVTSGA